MKLNKVHNVYSIFKYHPMRYFGSLDYISQMVLNYKMGYKEPFQDITALLYWVLADVKRDAIVVSIPSHDPKHVNSITKSARIIAKSLPHITDGTHLIKKQQCTQSFCRSSQRDVNSLKNSLYITCKAAIKGQNVIILDDVSTTGSSMQVVTEMLHAAGAKAVIRLAVAQTVKFHP